ncbi:MAG: C4-type zinc ribbon domain-containing protein [Anaerolineaceae bacterium]|nr:C4-type zinc ribbon domain-containing protein [Anaerolineaceae bacterium]
MNISLSLLRLQNLFTRRAMIRRRLEQIESILAEDEKVKLCAQSKQEAQQAFDLAQKDQSDHLAVMNERRLKKELTHAQLFGGKIKNPKELQDLEKEEKALEAYLSVLDEQMLEKMSVSDQATEALEASTLAYQNVLDQKSSESSLMAGERSKLQEELQPLNLQLKSLSAEIPNNVFAEFQEMLRSKKGRAVVEIIDGSCSGCGLDLTPAEIQKAKSSPIPVRCKNCGRMLYFKS